METVTSKPLLSNTVGPYENKNNIQGQQYKDMFIRVHKSPAIKNKHNNKAR